MMGVTILWIQTMEDEVERMIVMVWARQFL